MDRTPPEHAGPIARILGTLAGAARAACPLVLLAIFLITLALAFGAWRLI